MKFGLPFENSRMIEKPDISDEKIIVALTENYSIEVSKIEFLPIGNDASAFAYRVDAKNEHVYFLKLKRNLSNVAGLFVPRFLKDTGIAQVLTPLITRTGELWANVDDFALILYPFLTGNEAMSVGMTDAQWAEFGSVLKRIHLTELPSGFAQYVHGEIFVPKWSNVVRELSEQVNTRNYDDPYQKELARFWNEKYELIQTIIERTETMGKQLQQMDLGFVLCHADIHTANILMTPEQNMFIVDWDDALLAPKERDLMFILVGDTIQTKEEQLFFDGYGQVNINKLALAYYRYEWCVQEIGDFGGRVFLTTDASESMKRNSLEGFVNLFSPGNVIEATINSHVEI